MSNMAMWVGWVVILAGGVALSGFLLVLAVDYAYGKALKAYGGIRMFKQYVRDYKRFTDWSRRDGK
ncbi:hypothetical protein [Luteibacter sp. E-22]|uniref:hypothetical protein n=1 Tax=Luteibacter sp. E-22 TaxID=3404050 RepID=UPI003CEBF109